MFNIFSNLVYLLESIHKKYVCILSGCDYLPNLKGIGFNTIMKLFIKYYNSPNCVTSVLDEIK